MSDMIVTLRLKADGTGLAGELQKSSQQVKKFGTDVERLDSDGRKAATGLARAESSASRFGGALLGVSGIITALGLGSLVSDLVDVVRQFDSLEARVRTATGSAALAAADMQFIRDESERLGSALLETGLAYGNLSASAMGTTLAGQGVKELFLGVAEGATALSLTVDKTNDIITALGQVLSKGKVQAEEIRGQIGEHLPGAFQIAARSMNMTTAELDKQLSLGKVYAEDFLPKFGAELRKTFGADAVEQAHNLGSEMNRLGSAWNEFLNAVGDAGITDILKSAAIATTELLTSVKSTIASGIIPDYVTAQAEYFWQSMERGVNAVNDGMKSVTGVTIPEFMRATSGAIDGLFNAQIAMYADLPLHAGTAYAKIVQGIQHVAISTEAGVNVTASYFRELWDLIVAGAAYSAQQISAKFKIAFETVIQAAASMMQSVSRALFDLGVDSSVWGPIAEGAVALRGFSIDADAAQERAFVLGQRISQNHEIWEKYRLTVLQTAKAKKDELATAGDSAITALVAERDARDAAVAAAQRQRAAYAAAQEQATRFAIAADELDQAQRKSNNSTATASAGFEKYVEKMQASIKGLNALATAYGQGEVAVKAATLAAEIEAQVAQQGAEHRAKVVDLVTREAEARAKLDIAAFISDLEIETDLLAREAEAIQTGTDAVSDFAVQKEIENTLRGLNIELIGETGKALEKEIAVQVRANATQKQAVAASNELKRIIEQTRTPAEQYAVTMAEIDRVQTQAAASGQLTAGALIALDRARDQAQAGMLGMETTAEVLAGVWEQSVQRIDTAFVDMWENVLTGTGDFLDSLKNIVISSLAELAHAVLTRPIVMQIGASIVGAGTINAVSGAGSVVGAASGVSNLSGLGSLATGLNNLTAGLSDLGKILAPFVSGGAGLTNYGLAGVGGGALGGLGGAFYGYSQGGVRGAALGAGLGIAGGGFVGGALAGAGGGIGGVLTGGLAGAGASLGALGPIGLAALAGLAIFGVGKKTPHPWATAVAGELPGGTVNASGDTFGRSFSGQDQLVGASGLSFGLDFKHLGEEDAAVFQQALLAVDQALVDIVGPTDMAAAALGRFGVTAEGPVAGLADGIERMVESTEDILPQFFQDWIAAADTVSVPIKTMVALWTDGVEDMAAGVQGLILVEKALDADAIADAAILTEAANRTLFDTYNEQRAVVSGLIDSFDGSAQSAAELGQAVVSRYEKELQLILQIAAIAESVTATITSAREQIQLDMLEGQARFDFLINRAETEAAKIGVADDPVAVQQSAETATQYALAAWNTLSQEQKNIMGSEFDRFLSEIETASTGRLSEIETAIVSDSEQLKADLRTMLQDATDSINAAAATMATAANIQMSAANTPVVVNGTVSGSVRVTDDDGNSYVAPLNGAWA